MNGEENELLVLPLSWSMSDAVVVQAATKITKNGERMTEENKKHIEKLCSNMFMYENLPAPVHREDWLAQEREWPQSLDELARLYKTREMPKQKQYIYLLPLTEKHAPSLPLEELKTYIEAFFDQDIKCMDAITLNPPSIKPGSHTTGQYGKLEKRRVKWRNYCEAAEKELASGQYSANNLLDGLSAVVNIPLDAYCVLGVTMADLYSGEDDLFTVGLAQMAEPRIGVFSFARYEPHSGWLQYFIIIVIIWPLPFFSLAERNTRNCKDSSTRVVGCTSV
eukprot:m.64580 g.64580  ORF g.64580 m.64580 type:complete len:279 (+) comp11659_c0_seq3:564-1400(+)